MKNSFSLTISLPAQHLITFEAKRVRVPASDGYLGFMAGRQPLIASLGPGLIHIVDISDNEYWFATTGGFCEMLDNKAVLLCDSLVNPEEAKQVKREPDEPFYHKETHRMTEKQKIRYISILLAEKLRQLEESQEKDD
jgi:F-type H+-transporting ATPase subunit epsilon